MIGIESLIKNETENSFTVLSNTTGEVIFSDFKFHEKKTNKEKKLFQKKVVEYEAFKQYQSKELGSFVFFMFNNINKLTEILNDNELSRFVYIGTYVKKDGYLKLDNNKTYITKDKLNTMTRINKKGFNLFYNKLLSNNLIVEDGKYIKVNLDYFYKGQAETYKNLTGNKLKNFTRLYVDMIRSLYENTHSRSTGRLSILYKLIPLINWRHNVLCLSEKDVSEQDIDKLTPLTIADIVKKFGYAKAQMSRFRRDFYALKYKDQKVFGTFQRDEDYLDSIIVVNPRFLYRGNNIEDVSGILELFKLKG